MDRLEGGDLRQAVDGILRGYLLEVNYSGSAQPYEIQSITLDLTEERTDGAPYAVNFPFRSCYVVDATDSSVKCRLKLHSNDSWAQGIPLNLKDSMEFDFAVSKGFITNDAQPGKSVTIIFSVSSKFRSGSQISVTSGGSTISDGESATTLAAETATATAAKLFPQKSTRKKMVIKNGGTSTVYLGSSVVTDPSGGFPGIPLASGDVYEWASPSECYGVCAAAMTNSAIYLMEWT